MKNRFFSGVFLVALCLPFLGTAQPSAPKDTIPKPEVSVTKHSITIDGKAVNYTTTAGTLLLRNEQDEPIALYGFTAYTKDGVNDKSARPVMFAYNGGPGSSSIWLHMGALGPKRTVVNDPGLTPASPYKLADNKYSVLDIADLVMIDPVGTGLSRPVGKATGKDFWGVDQDIRTVSQFIKQYVTENDRWNSPKYLLGESYGTMRNAGVVDYLQENIGMAMNGVIMVSAVFDLRTITFAPGDDIPYIIYLPSYAASAWYHEKLPNKPANLEAFVEEVRVFANGDYAAALMKGDRLSDQEREKILGKLVAYTGLSKNYIERADLRVGPGEFEQELLRDDHNTMGRLDSRFKGINQDLLSQNADYDPQSSSISPAYTATFMNYFYNELKVNKKNSYHISAYGTGGFRWDWMRGPGGFGVPGANTATDMADALSKNPNLKIVIFNGYYDLATPFNGVEYTIDHLGLEKNIKSNIIMKYYEAGHMMYTHEPSLAKFKQDIVEFFRMTGN